MRVDTGCAKLLSLELNLTKTVSTYILIHTLSISISYFNTLLKMQKYIEINNRVYLAQDKSTHF